MITTFFNLLRTNDLLKLHLQLDLGNSVLSLDNTLKVVYIVKIYVVYKN